MSETELLEAVIDLAHLLKWRVAHFRPARTEQGWRTAGSGDVVGYPDLTMVRDTRLIFAELKSERGRTTVDQQDWLHALKAVAEVRLWRPGDWLDGSIEADLR